MILVRHGQTHHNLAGRVAGWTDSPLSAAGLAQAERLAAHLAGRYALDALYASPLQRARHTAEAVGRRLRLAPILRDDLRELNFGELENLTEAEISSRHPGVWAASLVLDDHSFTWPGGESRAGFYRRVRDAFDSIVAAHAGQTVAVVSHGGVLGAYVADVVEGRPHLWRQYLLKNCALAEVHVPEAGANADGETGAASPDAAAYPTAGPASVVLFNDHTFLSDVGGAGPDPFLESLARAASPTPADGLARANGAAHQQ